MGLPNQNPPPVLNLPFVQTTPSGFILTMSGGQFLQQLWASTPLSPCTFDALPLSPQAGMRGLITDSIAVAMGNFGVIAMGGGTSTVPIWYDGNHWRIG